MVVAISSSKRDYDIIIMGGGIIGTFCAWYAAAAFPNKKIALVEKGLVGKGATAYAAYLDFPYGFTAYKRALTSTSRELYANLLKQFPALPLKKLPFVGISSTRQMTAVIDRLTEPATAASAADCSRAFMPEGFNMLPGQSFFYNLTAGYADHDLTFDLAKELVNRKVQLLEGTEIVNFAEAGNGYVLETGYGTKLIAKAVIDATGPWMLLGPAAKYLVNEKLRTKKIIAFHIDTVPPSNAPVIYFFDNDAFVLPQPHFRRWLFSYRCPDWDVSTEASALAITPQNVKEAMEVLTQYNPGFCDRLSGGRVFCDLYSESGDPVILNPQPGLFLAGAGGGSGFRLAPGIAAAAIEQLAASGILEI